MLNEVPRGALLLLRCPQAPRLVSLLERGQHVLVRPSATLEADELGRHLLKAQLICGTTFEAFVEGLQGLILALAERR